MTAHEQDSSQSTHRPSVRLPVRRTRPGRSPRGLDEIAVEEPLEIRLRWDDDAGSVMINGRVPINPHGG